MSAFSDQTRDADSRAFCALLAHLKKIDVDKETVVMIQVENEIGMLPVARDYSPEATRAFHASAPSTAVDDDATSEIFTAHSYARYVESLVKADKAIYPNSRSQ